MSLSSSSDSVSSGPEGDVENDTSDSESFQNADVDSQSEDVESEGSIDGSSEGEEESADAGARITGKKRKRQEAEEEPTEEEKVLSHAEKRRQKKREEQKLKAPTAESGGKKSKKTSGADASAANSNTKRQNSVWVGNLSYKTTLDDLKAFFAEAGEITRINMPTKVLSGAARKPENRGFAYVDFTTPEAKTRAIAMSEQHLIGRKLLIKDGDDFAGRPQSAGSNASGDSAPPKMYSKTAQKILKAQKQPPGPTLFLGNLGFETTVADIMEMLNAHRSPSAGKRQATRPKDDKTDGKVVKDGSKEAAAGSSQPHSWIRKVRMGTFEDSGLCKGFAFVDFVSTEDATAALTNPKNGSLNGRKLVIEYASPDAVRRGAPKGSASAPKSVDGKTVDKRPRPVPRDDNEMEMAGKRRARIGVEVQSHERSPKRQRLDKPAAVTPPQKPGKRDYKGRSKPGAALASAQRESVAILPSQGKKIIFD